MPLSDLIFSSKSYWLPLVVGFLVLLGPAGVFHAQADPRADIGETVYDFGQVREDMALTHTFVVRNSGDQNLQILEVDPDCVCTVATYDRVIPPGGTAKISFEIKPFSVVHAFKKKDFVRFNAPSQPSVILVLKGKAQKIIEIEPSHIIRFRGSPRDNLTAQVRLTSNLPSPWEITKFQNSIPDKIDVALKTERPGKVYVIEVKNKSQDQGHYVGMIELFTNVVQKPKIVMRVIADLYLDSPGPLK
jgi:Protein of unknown function (DUF1573)